MDQPERFDMRLGRSRWLVLITMLCGLAGCQTTPAPFDPFLAGRSTIPPPATAIQPGTAPYYNAAPAASVGVPATSGAIYVPPGSTPAAAPGLNVPGAGSGFLPRGTSIPQSNHVRTSAENQVAGVAPAASRYFNPTAGAAALRATVNQTKDASDGGVVPASYYEPSRQSEIHIVEAPGNSKVTSGADGKLPPGTRTEAPLTASLRDADRSTSRGSLEPNNSPAADDSVSRSAAGYGYDPRYSWVKGKLEYSASQKRWKLRYIPIEGPTDEYGGSVVLAESEKLKSFEPGEFVLVQGRVLEPAENSKGFSPAYGIERIEKQS